MFALLILMPRPAIALTAHVLILLFRNLDLFGSTVARKVGWAMRVGEG